MSDLKFDLDNNQSNKSTALLISVFIYIVLLAMLYFFKLVYNPPQEADGVELNYGVDLVGSGDIQTMNKANDSKNNYDVKPSETNKIVKEVKPTPVAKETPAKVEKAKEVVKKVITSEADNHKVVVKETPKAPKTVNKPSVTPTPVTKPTTSTKPTNTTPSKPTKTPERTVDANSIYNPKNSSSGSNGTVGTKSGVGGNNNGDGKKGEVGDKGDSRGTLDGKSLYGNPGSGTGKGGASVKISGWKQRNLSLPKDNSRETGKIVFRVTVDDGGDVVGISVVESTVSPSVANFYKTFLQNKLSSSLVPDGTPPPRATGTITINITSGN